MFLEVTKVLLKVTEVTTEHQKWPLVSQNSIKSFFPPNVEALKVGPHSKRVSSSICLQKNKNNCLLRQFQEDKV